MRAFEYTLGARTEVYIALTQVGAPNTCCPASHIAQLSQLSQQWRPLPLAARLQSMSLQNKIPAFLLCKTTAHCWPALQAAGGQWQMSAMVNKQPVKPFSTVTVPRTGVRVTFTPARIGLHGTVIIQTGKTRVFVAWHLAAAADEACVHAVRVCPARTSSPCAGTEAPASLAMPPATFPATRALLFKHAKA